MAVDLSLDRIYPIGMGMLFCGACAPKSWSPEKVAEQVTRDNTPGTRLNEWVISDVDDDCPGPFAQGNPQPCPDSEGRQHWLLNCVVDSITPYSTFTDHRHCTVCGAVATIGTLQNISVKAERILCDKCSRERMGD